MEFALAVWIVDALGGFDAVLDDLSGFVDSVGLGEGLALLEVGVDVIGIDVEGAVEPGEALGVVVLFEVFQGDAVGGEGVGGVGFEEPDELLEAIGHMDHDIAIGWRGTGAIGIGWPAGGSPLSSEPR